VRYYLIGARAAVAARRFRARGFRDRIIESRNSPDKGGQEGEEGGAEGEESLPSWMSQRERSLTRIETSF